MDQMMASIVLFLMGLNMILVGALLIFVAFLKKEKKKKTMLNLFPKHCM